MKPFIALDAILSLPSCKLKIMILLILIPIVKLAAQRASEEKK